MPLNSSAFLLYADFKYWEDGSDEYHPLQGSLLPLWKFRPEMCRSFTVSDLCCSPVFPDLFAAAYTGLAANCGRVSLANV